MSDIIHISELNRYEQLLSKVNFGQSIFQDTYFGIEKEYTPHRKLRQLLLEYDQLCHTLVTNQIQQQKTDITKQRKELHIKELKNRLHNKLIQYEITTTELDIQSAELELKEIEIASIRAKKLIDDALARKANFEKLLAQIVPQVEELEKQGIDFEEAERMYWITRFAENANLDKAIAGTGRIFDRENIRSILRLPPIDRNVCLEKIGIGGEVQEILNEIADQYPTALLPKL